MFDIPHKSYRLEPWNLEQTFQTWKDAGLSRIGTGCCGARNAQTHVPRNAILDLRHQFVEFALYSINFPVAEVPERYKLQVSF